MTAASRFVEVARAANGVILTSGPLIGRGRLFMRWEAKDGPATWRMREGGDCRSGLRLSAQFVRRLRGNSATHVRLALPSYQRRRSVAPRHQVMETNTKFTRGRTLRPGDHEGRTALGRS